MTHWPNVFDPETNLDYLHSFKQFMRNHTYAGPNHISTPLVLLEYSICKPYLKDFSLNIKDTNEIEGPYIIFPMITSSRQQGYLLNHDIRFARSDLVSFLEFQRATSKLQMQCPSDKHWTKREIPASKPDLDFILTRITSSHT